MQFSTKSILISKKISKPSLEQTHHKINDSVAGPILPDAVSTVEEDEAELDQQTHSKKKKWNKKEKAQLARTRISNMPCPKCENAEYGGGGGSHDAVTTGAGAKEDPSHTVVDDFIQGAVVL